MIVYNGWLRMVTKELFSSFCLTCVSPVLWPTLVFPCLENEKPYAVQFSSQMCILWHRVSMWLASELVRYKPSRFYTYQPIHPSIMYAVQRSETVLPLTTCNLEVQLTNSRNQQARVWWHQYRDVQQIDQPIQSLVHSFYHLFITANRYYMHDAVWI